MDLKIQQTYPQASHGISNFNTLCYSPNISALILYGQQVAASNANTSEQPKKKIAFKANKSQATPIIDKISIFSLQQRKWEIKECKGKIPSKRSQYNVLQMRQCMIMYGGRNQDKYYNDIHALNTETWTWKKLFSIQNPSSSKNSLFCKLNENSACLISSDILWILHIEDVKWQLASNQLPGSVWQKLSIQLPKNPLFCVKSSETQILIFGQEKCYSINFNEKRYVSQAAFNPRELFNFDKNHKIKGCSFLNKAGKYEIILVSEKRLIILDYLKEGDNFQLLQNKSLDLDFNIHCQILTTHQQRQLFMMDSKGQLYSISLAQSYFSEEQPQTTRIIQSPDQRNQNTIAQEQYGQDEASSVLVSSQVNQIKRSKQIRQSSENIQEVDRRSKKMKSQDNFRLTSQIAINEGEDSQFQQPSIIKEKLSIIYTHEHLKRRLLEEKVKKLEEIIKKSQRFVLLLCRYGNSHNKKKHINQVKAIRQNLQHCISKEAYYRKQMSANQIPRNISKAVEQTIQNIDQ